jgi:hypothetical protein
VNPACAEELTRLGVDNPSLADLAPIVHEVTVAGRDRRVDGSAGGRGDCSVGGGLVGGRFTVPGWLGGRVGARDVSVMSCRAAAERAGQMMRATRW